MEGFLCADKERELVHFARSLHCDLLFVREINLRTGNVQDLNGRFCVVSFESVSSTQSTGVGSIVSNRSLLPGSWFKFCADGRVIVFHFILGYERCLVVPPLLCATHSLTPCARFAPGPTLSFSVEISIVFLT